MPTEPTSYLSIYAVNGVTETWLALATREHAEDSQSRMKPENRGGITPASCVPGTTYHKGHGMGSKGRFAGQIAEPFAMQSVLRDHQDLKNTKPRADDPQS